MKVLYFLLLIAIPTWGLDGTHSGLSCKFKTKDEYDLVDDGPLMFTLELGSCQDHDLKALLFTPNLRWLTVLHCESNFSTSHLAAPPNLEILRLRLGNVTELPLLDNMSKLEKLDLQRNRIERVANGAFRGVTNLRELYLQDNFIRELPEDVFHPLKKLKFLDLSRNQISQLSRTFLPSDSELKALYLRENPLVKLKFSLISYPRSIDEIDLTDCREMRGELILPFKIRTLSLEGSGVDSVHAFWLIDLKAANSKVNVLEVMPYLKELNLRGTDLDSLEVDQVLRFHQMLETVDLSNNSITYIPGEEDWRVWASFRKLNLSRNGLTSLPPNCPLFGVKLTSLDVSYNKLRSIDMAAFEGTYHLKSLFLQGNQIYNFNYRSDKLCHLNELAFFNNILDKLDFGYCRNMEGYFENNLLILHSSFRGYTCRKPDETWKLQGICLII